MRPFVVLTFLIAAALAAGGCVDNDGASLYISGHVAPSGDDCTLEAGNALVSRGVFNVESRFGYFAFPLYNNQLRSRGSDAPLRTDPNGIHLQGAEVELQDAAGGLIDFGPGLPNPFSVPTSGFVPSTPQANAASQVVGNILAIPPAYADVLFEQLGGEGGDDAAATVVIASIRVFGETNGDVDVESDDWLWPIDVCRGTCLFQCISAEDVAESICCTPGQDFTCDVPLSSSVCM